jgi:hypothetical protein
MGFDYEKKQQMRNDPFLTFGFSLDGENPQTKTWQFLSFLLSRPPVPLRIVKKPSGFQTPDDRFGSCRRLFSRRPGIAPINTGNNSARPRYGL